MAQKSILKVTVKGEDGVLKPMFVQQVTEKIVVLAISTIETKYMRRDTGTAYSPSDRSGLAIAYPSLSKVEDFMKLCGKAKWHSGWKPSKDAEELPLEDKDFESYQIKDCTTNAAEILSSINEQRAMRPVTVAATTKKATVKKVIPDFKPLGDELFDEFATSGTEKKVSVKPTPIKSDDFEASSSGEFDDIPPIKDDEFDEPTSDDFDDFDEQPDFSLGAGPDENF